MWHQQLSQHELQNDWTNIMPRVAKTKEFAARNTVTLNYDHIPSVLKDLGPISK
jgi:hypothetical protein